MYTRQFFLTLLSICFVFELSLGQNKTSEENVVIQMNYCINSLTNIIHNKSMSVLEHESDQLVNNLTMEQIIGLPEIRDFRIDLMDAIGKFEITEEERALMRRVQSIKRDNQKWAAISNALSSTMMLTGGGNIGPQLAYQTLLTAARSVVEYQVIKGEQNIEELQAMWQLRKEDMTTINNLRKSAQRIIFDLYNKYNLKENDRLTESTSNLFSEYIADPNASKRVRVLEDNFDTYKTIPEYYYHLGMAYLDLGNFMKAKQNFLHYLEVYKRTPFLRYDERSGCIALAMLTYDKSLSEAEKNEYINCAIKNLPDNSAAVLQCAMVYIYEMNSYEEGFRLLRSGIDNHHASDPDLLLMAAANLLPLIQETPLIYSAISEIFSKTNSISYDSYLTYLIYSKKNSWLSIRDLNKFDNCYSREWYTLWINKKFSREFSLSLPPKISFNTSDFCIYDEFHDDNGVKISQLEAQYKHAISEKQIQKIDCFKSNKYLKYLYLDVLSPGVYRLKSNINIDKIKDESWPRQSEFTLSQDDIDDIVDFCKDNVWDDSHTEIQFKGINNKNCQSFANNNYNVVFYGDSLAYEPYHSSKQKGHYVKIVLNNALQVVYHYDDADSMLIPYCYFNGTEKVFWNDAAKNEFEFQETVIKQESISWWCNIWSSVKGWFSSDDDSAAAESTRQIQEEDPSWWCNMWSSVKGWFSSDDKEKKNI